MKSECEKIIDILTHTFEKNAWHGPSVLEAVEDITADMATKRIGESHSIVELVTHMTAWRNFVSEQLEGNGEFDLTEEENFPKHVNWEKALSELRGSQQRLLKAISQTPDELLSKKVSNRPYKFFTMLHGIIHHDLYHTGQIVLLKKSITNVRK